MKPLRGHTHANPTRAGVSTLSTALSTLRTATPGSMSVLACCGTRRRSPDASSSLSAHRATGAWCVCVLTGEGGGRGR
eukprot:365667-Chlamydomonas_euryale.AAC.9